MEVRCVAESKIYGPPRFSVCVRLDRTLASGYKEVFLRQTSKRESPFIVIYCVSSGCLFGMCLVLWVHLCTAPPEKLLFSSDLMLTVSDCTRIRPRHLDTLSEPPGRITDDTEISQVPSAL